MKHISSGIETGDLKATEKHYINRLEKAFLGGGLLHEKKEAEASHYKNARRTRDKH